MDAIDTLRNAVKFFDCIDEHINTRFKTTADLVRVYQYCRDAQCGINDLHEDTFIVLIGYNPTRYTV